MGQDGVQADIQFVGNLLIRDAFDDQLEDVSLAGRKVFAVFTDCVSGTVASKQLLQLLDDNLLRCLDGYMVGGRNTASTLSPIDQYRGFATAGRKKSAFSTMMSGEVK